MLSAPFFFLIVALFFMRTASSLLIINHLPQKNHGSSTLESQSLLPAANKVLLHFHIIEKKDYRVFNQSARKFLQESAIRSSQFAAVLKRRDGLNMYGRQIVHSEHDANCATLVFLDEDTAVEYSSAAVGNTWDATLKLTPTELKKDPLNNSLKNMVCFVAMNRFEVKEECKKVFEARWSERKSKLSVQPGFLGFSLLRKMTNSPSDKNEEESFARFNYSTCTVWDSEDSWLQWRNGEGRSSHYASRTANAQRVPMSEWLKGPSSPIFWEGEITAVTVV